MADETYSLEAVLSARDAGYQEGLKKAGKAAASFGKTLKSGVAFGVFQSVGTKAINVVTSAFSGLKSVMSENEAAWSTFSDNMAAFGKSKKEIKSVRKDLSKFAADTIYSASDMAQAYSQLSAVGIDNCGELVKAFGGLAASASNPTQAMKTLTTQGVQMAAKPKIAWMDFKLMLEQAPAGVAAVAKQMQKSGELSKGTVSELISKVQDGDVATKDFFEAMEKTAGSGTKFEKMATHFKTLDQAIDGTKETLTQQLQPVFSKVSKIGIKWISKLNDKFSSINGGAIAKKVGEGLNTAIGKIQEFVGKAGKYWSTFIEVMAPVGQAFKDAFSAVKESISGINSSFGSSKSVDGFRDSLQKVADVLTKVAGFIKDHSKEIGKAISTVAEHLPQLVAGFMALKVVKRLAPGITAVGSAIGKLAGKGIKGLAGKLSGASKGVGQVGTAAGSSWKDTLSMAVAIAAIGASVWMASQGLSTLAGAAIQVASAGTPAIAVFAGMVGGIVLLSVVLAKLGPQLQGNAVGLLAFGAAILMAGTGMYLIAAAATQVASAGTPAIAVFAGMYGGVLLLVGAMAAAAPALTAGAVGMIAFGAACVLVGAGLLLASAALAVVVAVLPGLIANASAGAKAILTFSAAFVGAGAMAVAGAVLFLTAGAMALAGGVIALSGGVMFTAAGAMAVAGGALAVVGGAIFIAAGAMVIMGGAVAVGGGAMFIAAGALVIASGAMAIAGAGMFVGAGALLAAAAIGAGLLAASLKLVQGSLSSAAGEAKKTAASLRDMEKSVNIVDAGLDAIKSGAKSAIGALADAFSGGGKDLSGSAQAISTSLMQVGTAAATVAPAVSTGMNAAAASVKAAMAAIKSAASAGMTASVAVVKSGNAKIIAILKQLAAAARSAGSRAGLMFVAGIRSGSAGAGSAARSAAAAASSGFSSAGSAYSDGADFAQGYVNGILSKVPAARSAGSKLANAGHSGVKNEQKSGSPSRVEKKDGEDFSAGYAVGIASSKSKRKVKKAAKKLTKAARKQTKKPTKKKSTFAGAIVSGISDLSEAAGRAAKLVKGTMLSAVKKHNYSDSAQKASDAYSKELTKYQKKVLKSAKKQMNASIKAYSKTHKSKQTAAYKKDLKKIYSAYESAQKKEIEKAQSAADKMLTNLGTKFQDKYDELTSKRSDLYSTLSDVGDLFSSDKYGFVKLKDFKSATRQLTAYGKNLEALKKIMPKGYMAEVLKLSPSEGLALTEQLLKLSPTVLTQYGRDYSNFISAASAISTNYFAADMKKLDQEYTKEANTIFADLKSRILEIEKTAQESLAKTLGDKSKSLQTPAAKQTAASAADNLKKQAKENQRAIKAAKKANNTAKKTDKKSNQFAKAGTIKPATIVKAVKPVKMTEKTANQKAEKIMKALGGHAAKGWGKGLSKAKLKSKIAAKLMAGTTTKTIEKQLGIHSPSRVMTGLGQMTGQGYINGMESKIIPIQRAMRKMTTPDISSMKSPSAVMSLSDDYEYRTVAEYTIEVPIQYDGREVARVTAPYTEAELSRRQSHESRKRGIS